MHLQAAPTPLRGELPFTPDAPSIAREQLRRVMRDMPAAAVEDAALMVSELVTNALVHGQPEITLFIRQRTNRLTVAVADLSDATVACVAAASDQTHGRGLVIVNALATCWGVRRSDGRAGKQVWFDIDGAAASLT
jgi:anti-sigma regulatory factor (Ser/Thr protein kinase)